MALALSTYRSLVNFKLFFSLCVFIFSIEALAQKNCKASQLALDSGRDLFQRRQFLLSIQEFSMAEKFDCAEQLDQAMWGHLLAVTELGERDEMFHLSHKLYPLKFSLGYQQKLKLYQSYYFPKNDGTVEAQRVNSFEQWKENLPQQKSPALAGTLSAVLPGAGQAYTGSWQSGAMAFVLNALFLSATLELEDKDLPATALVSGVVFSITYLGNILNAAESARIYNQNYNAPQIEEEKAKRFPELTL
ncbi:hypothetical protein [Pseudobdellovibrio sp. HCB154]|uniref:hypothetical protein n=1 Tax=Pseudobdellovibrio sp. HCB154 TaxID=3386277 RepID=UPI003917329D